MSPVEEINFSWSKAFHTNVDFTDRMPGLRRAAAAMTKGDWATAKIATLHLRLPVPTSRDLTRLQVATEILKATFVPYGTVYQKTVPQTSSSSLRVNKKQAALPRRCECGSDAGKRDVSNEPRIPRGQTGGGEWTFDSSEFPSADPFIVPAQITLPFPGTIPMPTPEPVIPILPPLPLFPNVPDVIDPNVERQPSNPFPKKKKCVEEWAYAEQVCRELQQKKKLKPGYDGFGKNYARCVLGMVSEECGGNPTA